MAVLDYTVAVDAASGQFLWRYEAPLDTTGLAAGATARPGQVVDARIDADEAAVYVPAWGASVSAVALRTGQPIWTWHPGRSPTDTFPNTLFRSGSMGVRVHGDTVLATVWHFLNRQGGSSEAWVVALDRKLGSELWRVVLPLKGAGVLIRSAPALYHDLVIVNTVSASAFAIESSTQRIAWGFKSPAAVNSTVAGIVASGDTVFVDGGDQRIYALRASDGVGIWRSEFASQTSRDMIVTPRRVIFTNGGSLYVLDLQSGQQVAAVTQPRTSDPLFASAPGFGNGLIVVSVADAIWCFDEP